MQSKSKKITYAAVGAAISSVCVALTNFVPLRVSLLMFAALCYYIVFCKSGLVYGLADIAVSLLITLFVGGVSVLSSAFLLTAVVFAPYAIVGYLLRKLYYTQIKTALIRVAVMIVFANLALLGVWLLAGFITSIDVLALMTRLGGYALFALVFSALTVVFDVLFNQLSIRLVKLIK